MEFNVLCDHHPLEDLIVIGGPNLERKWLLIRPICADFVSKRGLENVTLRACLINSVPCKNDCFQSCLFEEGLVELALDLLRCDAARRLKLLWRDAYVFHVGAQHEVNLNHQ